MEKIKILVVSNEQTFIAEAISSLEKNCFMEVVAIANDGQEAIEKIETYTPDLIIIDLFLQRIDGIGVIEYAENIKMYNPIIIATGYAISPFVFNVLHSKNITFVRKPIDFKLLTLRICNNLY